MFCVGEGVWVCVDHLAFNLVGPTTIISNDTSDRSDISSRHCDGLSIVERFNGGQEILVLLNQVGQLDEVLASLLWCRLLPCALESLARRCYSNVDILLCGLVDGGDDFFCGRVDDLEGPAIDTRDEFIVDEPAQQPSVSAGSTGRRQIGERRSSHTYSPVGWVNLPVMGVWSSTETEAIMETEVALSGQ